MKGRFVFTSGMAAREFDTTLSVDELIASEFGSLFALQDVGGSVEVYSDPEPTVEVVEEVAESKSTKKRKAAQKEESDK